MKVLYAGSFHPPTIGHIDIISRASALFDEVIVAVMVNAEKKYTLSAQARVDMLKKCTAGMKNVTVVCDNGLQVDLCRRENVDAILRGLRSETDYAYEQPIAEANKAIGGPETVYISASPQYAFISSTIASDVARHGGDLSRIVPSEIIEEVTSVFGK